MNLKKVKYLIYALAAALFVTAMAAYWLESVALVVITVGLCVAIAVASFELWRCPHCGRHLGRVDGKPKFCPQCGGKLNDFE